MNLKTIIFVFVSLVLLATLASGQSSPYNKLDKLKVNDLIAGKLQVQSTTNASVPCPSMTQVQRDAVASPTEGLCVYNSDSNTLNIYDGTDWVEVGSGGGSGGGIANWETAKFYEVGDVVIESTKIYQANTQHTSTVFASDIANWTKLVAPISLTSEVSGVLPMANGGTDKNLSPVLGGVVYTDAGSMEVLGAGASGQFLKSNGGAAPSWEDIVVNDSSFSGLLSLSKGGTNKNLTAEDGAILYLDADSVEKLSPGTSGQVLQSNGAGAPSFVNKSISAKSENGSSVTLEEVQVSNNQLTQTDTNKHLIESGNNNLLVNPSFEHSTFSTGWTNSNGTFAEETVIELHGKKAAKVTLTAQALSLHQDSTLYASQFADGVQGLASVRVKTSVSGIKVCSRQAGVTVTSLCVDVQANGKWGLYKVPFILGATSNGISINSNGTSVTGTVYIDDAFVGAQDLTQNSNACNSVNCETVFSAKISSTGVTSDESLDWILGNASLSATNYTITFNPSIFTVAPNCTYVSDFNNGLVHVTGVSISSSSVTVRSGRSDSNTNYAGSFEIICQKQGVDFTAAKQLSNGNTYSSTNADTDWASCGHTAASFTGFGTVSAIETQCKRQGSDLLMKGKFTIGTPTAVEARVSLPVWNGTQLVSAGTQKITSLQLSGSSGRSGFATTTQVHQTIIEPSVPYITFSNQIGSNYSHLSKRIGTELTSNGELYSFNARIPIEGWQNSNIIIGQFNGLESCTSTLDCTDTFSAKISAAGVTSEENVDFINGSCSLATNVYTCNFNSSIFTVAPTCTITPLEPTAINGTMGMITTQSSSSVVYKTVRHDSAALTAPVNIICQKQGVDYVGKTAKSVASDQNTRTPGITKSVVYSANVSSIGNVVTEIGDFIQGSCSVASSVHTCSFVTNTFISSPVCVATSANATFNTITDVAVSGVTSVQIRTGVSTSGVGGTFGYNLMCHGVSP